MDGAPPEVLTVVHRRADKGMCTAMAFRDGGRSMNKTAGYSGQSRWPAAYEERAESTFSTLGSQMPRGHHLLRQSQW